AMERFHELGPLGSRPDKAHITGEHVPELRQLVQSCPAEPATDSGDSRIVFCRPHGSVPLGVDGHRAKLLEDKDTAPLAYPLLTEEYGPFRIELHGARHQ